MRARLDELRYCACAASPYPALHTLAPIILVSMETTWMRSRYSKMAATDLVQLINLSLGVEPRGVVNFNYLHGLLHEIVKRLVTLEGLPVALLEPEDKHTKGPTPHYDQRAGVSTTDDLRTSAEGKATGGGRKDGDRETSEREGVPEGAESRGSHKSPTHVQSEMSLDSDRETSNSNARLLSGDSSEGREGSIKRLTSGYAQSRANLVSAANDLGALERKLHDLESRVNTMESLPKLLERKSSDSGATPVSDMWNFTNLNSRVGATEESLEKVCTGIHLIM